MTDMTPSVRTAVLEAVVDRLTWARTHGMQYDGARDIYKVAGYHRTLTYDHYAGAYERDPVAGRIVDMVAEATWRHPPEIVEEDHPDGTPFTEAWAELAQRLRVWQKLEAADKLARIGQYSVVSIGVAGVDDAGLVTPVTRASADQILFLAPHSQKYTDFQSWDADPGSERYGLPDIYTIDQLGTVTKFRTQAGRQSAGRTPVHHTRVLHVAEDCLDNEVFGRPALQRVMNALHDLIKISASSGEAYWQRVAGILQAKLDPNVQWTDAQLAEIDEWLKEIYHDLRNTAYLAGGELSRLSADEPEPSGAAKLAMQLCAVGSGIPMRRLFGSELGERSSEEDQKTFYGSMSDRQITHAEPGMVRPLIDRLIAWGALPKPTTRKYQCVWPPLFAEPEKDIAAANLSRAQAAKALTPVGGDPIKLIEVDAERNVWLVPRKEGDASPFEDDDLGMDQPMPPGAEEEPDPDAEGA